MDTSLFLLIYGASHHSPLLDGTAVFFAEYSQYVWVLILLIALFWPYKDRVQNRTVILISIGAALFARLVVKTAILSVYSRPRPFVSLPDIHPLIATLPYENLQSFPSGHAMFFFAIATVVFCFNKRIGLVAFIAAALMAIARVYVGVHWPSDVVGGAIIGALIGWLAYLWYERASARHSLSPW